MITKKGKSCCDICGLDLGSSFFRTKSRDVCWTCRDVSENSGGLVCLRRKYIINNIKTERSKWRRWTSQTPIAATELTEK